MLYREKKEFKTKFFMLLRSTTSSQRAFYD